MNYSVVNFKEKFSKLNEQFSPRIIAKLNDYYFKICRFQGDFVWHTHSDTDEAFIVNDGEMKIKFREGEETICQGEMFVVPKNTEHKPCAEKECKIMLVEPMGTLNTGDNETSELTAEENVWI